MYPNDRLLQFQQQKAAKKSAKRELRMGGRTMSEGDAVS